MGLRRLLVLPGTGLGTSAPIRSPRAQASLDTAAKAVLGVFSGESRGNGGRAGPPYRELSLGLSTGRWEEGCGDLSLPEPEWVRPAPRLQGADSVSPRHGYLATPHHRGQPGVAPVSSFAHAAPWECPRGGPAFTGAGCVALGPPLHQVAEAPSPSPRTGPSLRPPASVPQPGRGSWAHQHRNDFV